MWNLNGARPFNAPVASWLNPKSNLSSSTPNFSSCVKRNRQGISGGIAMASHSFRPKQYARDRIEVLRTTTHFDWFECSSPFGKVSGLRVRFAGRPESPDANFSEMLAHQVPFPQGNRKMTSKLRSSPRRVSSTTPLNSRCPALPRGEMKSAAPLRTIQFRELRFRQDHRGRITLLAVPNIQSSHSDFISENHSANLRDLIIPSASISICIAPSNWITGFRRQRIGSNED